MRPLAWHGHLTVPRPPAANPRGTPQQRLGRVPRRGGAHVKRGSTSSSRAATARRGAGEMSSAISGAPRSARSVPMMAAATRAPARWRFPPAPGQVHHRPAAQTRRQLSGASRAAPSTGAFRSTWLSAHRWRRSRSRLPRASTLARMAVPCRRARRTPARHQARAASYGRDRLPAGVAGRRDAGLLGQTSPSARAAGPPLERSRRDRRHPGRPSRG